MAFIFSREKTLGGQKKFQQYMIIAFIGVMLITVFVLWKGFFKGGSQAPPRAVAPVFIPKKVEIDLAILQNAIFDELENPPPKVTVPKTVGRDNPFIPF